MRKVIAFAVVGGAALLGSASGAAATHTGGGCEHGVTAHAHATVPHRNSGTHTAHSKIPYCPPTDAPR